MGNKSALQLEVEKRNGLRNRRRPVRILRALRQKKTGSRQQKAGRAWGEDGYGDKYLSLLIPDVIREMAFSAYCDKRSAENLAARKAVS